MRLICSFFYRFPAPFFFLYASDSHDNKSCTSLINLCIKLFISFYVLWYGGPEAQICATVLWTASTNKTPSHPLFIYLFIYRWVSHLSLRKRKSPHSCLTLWGRRPAPSPDSGLSFCSDASSSLRTDPLIFKYHNTNVAFTHDCSTAKRVVHKRGIISPNLDQ